MLSSLLSASTPKPWKRIGVSRIVGVSQNGILRTEDADLICFLRNNAEVLNEIIEIASTIDHHALQQAVNKLENDHE